MKKLLFLLMMFPVVLIAQPGNPDANGVVSPGPPWVTGVSEGDGELKAQFGYLSTRIDSLEWLVPNAQTDTLYTFVFADKARFVTFNNADTVNVTVPSNSSVAFAIGTTLEFGQLGAGPVIVTGAGAVIINAYNSDTIMAGQYAVGSLLKTGTDTWLLFGNF